MPSPSATKASEKQQACKKLLSLLQKEYGKTTPKLNMPVLETMLFAACLENNSWDEAKHGFENLDKLYYDLNEIRVSSVAEIEGTLDGLRGSDWAGLRIRSILRFVFESTYTYDYEKLKRLTQDSAQKRLKKIDNMSPFIRNFTVQQSLAGYLVCLDRLSTLAAIHLGIVPPGSTEEQAGEFLKPGLKKADTFGFTCALRCLATDPRFIDRLSEPPDEDAEFNVRLVETRFSDLKKPKKKKRKPAVAAKETASKGRSRKKKMTAGKNKTKKSAARATTAESSTAGKPASRVSKAAKATSKKSSVTSNKGKKTGTSKAAKNKTAAAKKKATGKAKAATAKKKGAKASAARKSSVKKTARKKSSVKKKATKKKVARKKK